MNAETPENTVVDTKNSGVHSKSEIVSVFQKDEQDVANIGKSDTKVGDAPTDNIDKNVSQSDEIGRIFAEKKPEDAHTQGDDEAVEQILHAAAKSEKAKEVIAEIKNEEANAQANNTSIKIEDRNILAEPVSPNATKLTENKIEDVHSEVKSDDMPASVEAKTANLWADNNFSEKKDIPTGAEVVDTISEKKATSSEVDKTNESEVASVEVKSGDTMTKEPEMVMQSKENVTPKTIATEVQTEEPIPLIPDASKELNEVRGLTEKLSTTVKTLALAREALGTVKEQKGMQ